MRRATLIGGVLLALAACAPREDEAAPAATAAPDTAPAAAAGAGDWVAAPGLPQGAQMRVISGDPGAAGPFTVHLRFPDDYRVPPHTHPADETVRIVSGVFHVGSGRTFDMNAMSEMRPGQSVDIRANDPHYAHASGETVIEVRSTGPFGIDWVNPADAPAN
jgi:quercetin dioxygenase-like cupin family protein